LSSVRVLKRMVNFV